MVKWPSNLKRQLSIQWMNQLSLFHVGDADKFQVGDADGFHVGDADGFQTGDADGNISVIFADLIVFLTGLRMLGWI